MPVSEQFPGARVEIHGVCQDTVDALDSWLAARVGSNREIIYYPFRGLGLEHCLTSTGEPLVPEADGDEAEPRP